MIKQKNKGSTQTKSWNVTIKNIQPKPKTADITKIKQERKKERKKERNKEIKEKRK